MSAPAPAAFINVLDLADLMDNCADDAGQWSGGDVCDELAALIERNHGWKSCAEHGQFSPRKPYCPWCAGDGIGVPS